MVAFLRESIIKSFLIVSNLPVLNHFSYMCCAKCRKTKNDRPHLLQIKSWLINFNGVTNKYLQHYLNWHTFLECNKSPQEILYNQTVRNLTNHGCYSNYKVTRDSHASYGTEKSSPSCNEILPCHPPRFWLHGS